MRQFLRSLSDEKHFSTALALLAAIFPLRALADVDGFWVWQPDPQGVRYLLPKVKGVSPEKLAENYQQALRSSPVYGVMENAQKLALSTEPWKFSEMPGSSFEHPNVAVVLNRPNQMTRESSYLPTVVRSFEREGPNLLSIPVGLETVLSPEDLRQFRTQIDSLDGMLGVGGDDPHPTTYYPNLYGPVDISLTKGDISAARDAEQTAYMTHYLEHGKGRVFFICGSMQRAAIADGFGFHPDISHLTQTAHSGEKGPVLLEIDVDPDSELALAAGSTRFKTSSSHHAGIDPTQPQDPARPPTARVTAYNVEPDGSIGKIPKAIEFQNNAGFATQFHTEFRGTPEEEKIVRYVAAGWKLRGRPSPQAILRCVAESLKSP